MELIFYSIIRHSCVQKQNVTGKVCLCKNGNWYRYINVNNSEHDSSLSSEHINRIDDSVIAENSNYSTSHFGNPCAFLHFVDINTDMCDPFMLNPYIINKILKTVVV